MTQVDALATSKKLIQTLAKTPDASWSPATANGADGISDIEGKVARVAMSKLGNE
jgi:hypothetical protein